MSEAHKPTSKPETPPTVAPKVTAKPDEEKASAPRLRTYQSVVYTIHDGTEGYTWTCGSETGKACATIEAAEHEAEAAIQQMADPGGRAERPVAPRLDEGMQRSRPVIPKRPASSAVRERILTYPRWPLLLPQEHELILQRLNGALQREIGAACGVSASRIHQREAAAFRKLFRKERERYIGEEKRHDGHRDPGTTA